MIVWVRLTHQSSREPICTDLPTGERGVLESRSIPEKYQNVYMEGRKEGTKEGTNEGRNLFNLTEVDIIQNIYTSTKMLSGDSHDIAGATHTLQYLNKLCTKIIQIINLESY